MIDIDEEDGDKSHSVLEIHHQKNRTIRPPDPRSLSHMKHRASAQDHPIYKHPSSSAPDSNRAHASSGAQPPQAPHRGRQSSQTQGNTTGRNVTTHNQHSHALVSRLSSGAPDSNRAHASSGAQPPQAPHRDQHLSQSQGSNIAAQNDNNDSNSDIGDVSDGSNPPDNTTIRVRRRNMNTTPVPTQLRFYSGCWLDVLKDAKFQYRLYIHTEDPFPERSRDSLSDAHKCLLEAISKFQEEVKLELKESVSHFSFMRVD